MEAKTLFCAALAAIAVPSAAQISPASRILVVTGGHAYDAPAFNAMWDSFGGNVTVRSLARGHEVFDDISGWNHDILVFYNHQNPGADLAARHKENFRALLERGVGMFVLHHAVAAYPHFPEFAAMAGGKYRSSAYYSDSLSTYRIPVDIRVLAVQSGHPLAQGVAPAFTVNDEIYLKMAFAPDNDVVFRTDYAGADGPIAWRRRAGNSRVFTTILGNGSGIFSHADFRRLVKNGLDHVLPCVSGDLREVCRAPVSLAGPAIRPVRDARRAGRDADGEGNARNGFWFGPERPGLRYSADGRRLIVLPPPASMP